MREMKFRSPKGTDQGGKSPASPTTKMGNLPEGVQITPSRFLFFSKSHHKILVTIHNMTWTTYAVFVVPPIWLKCEKKFMLQPQTITELEFTCDNKEVDKSIEDVVRFAFTDMANKSHTYAARLHAQYSPNADINDPFEGIDDGSSYLQLAIVLLLLTAFLLSYHYRFQVKYYLCVFQSVMCQYTKESKSCSWWDHILRC